MPTHVVAFVDAGLAREKCLLQRIFSCEFYRQGRTRKGTPLQVDTAQKLQSSWHCLVPEIHIYPGRASDRAVFPMREGLESGAATGSGVRLNETSQPKWTELVPASDRCACRELRRQMRQRA